MDIEELSVGDWVYSSFCEQPCKVTHIAYTEHGYSDVGVENVVGLKDFASLTPIPLTAEILEKNGFIEIVEDIYKCCVGEVYIEIGIYKPMFIYIGASVITPEEVYDTDILSTTKANGGDFFVHDLQHALRLSGIDKKIKL